MDKFPRKTGCRGGVEGEGLSEMEILGSGLVGRAQNEGWIDIRWRSLDGAKEMQEQKWWRSDSGDVWRGGWAVQEGREGWIEQMVVGWRRVP